MQQVTYPLLHQYSFVLLSEEIKKNQILANLTLIRSMSLWLGEKNMMIHSIWWQQKVNWCFG